MQLSLILSIGRDAVLLETRNQVLRADGYVVESELSLKRAICRFEEGDFDLIIFCHSIAAEDQDRFICLIRASGSQIPVVSVSHSLDQEPSLTHAVIACGPKEVLNGVKQALAQAAEACVWSAKRLWS